MSRLRSPSLLLAIPATLITQAAWADLTPAQVWGDWRDYMENMGYTVEAEERASGDTLTVSDVTMRMQMPEDGGSFSMSMGTLTFVQQDNGAVDIRMPEKMPMAIDVAPEGPDDEPVSMVLTYGQSGPLLTASGTPEALQYDYAAETISLTLAGLKIGEESYGEDQARFSLIGTDVRSRTEMKVDDQRSYAQTGQIGNLQYDVLMNTPDDPASLKLKGGVLLIDFEAGGDLPTLDDAADMAAMVQAGMAMDGSFSAGAGNAEVAVSDPENGDFGLTSSSAGTKLSVKMGPEGLHYAGGQQEIAVDVTSADMPFPITFSMAETGFNLKAPLLESEEPQDFAFGLTLNEFQMSDMIWGIFDPAGHLPRDPASLVVDLSGKAKLLFDLMDPEAAAAETAAEPAEIHALSVNELSLDAAGAAFNGTGDLTFDNSDLETVPGFPKPVGALDLSLVGGIALMDKLVSMGLLPQEQALGARMMIGLFTVPAGGEDSLKSKIEFTEEGAILANGQRVK
ncbi:DUF2125 domain-containing protein [Sulfitobacter sp. PS-8MA]|uniref:DUF2125 domain-containing protein n=1 Tax=Sulfitobacter sp. PS-8MA TaxID=3237707 RepID=UPI0034C682AB